MDLEIFFRLRDTFVLVHHSLPFFRLPLSLFSSGNWLFTSINTQLRKIDKDCVMRNLIAQSVLQGCGRLATLVRVLAAWSLMLSFKK